MYQYLSWFHRGKSYPSGNKLLTIETANKLKASLLTTGVEVHESVQRYDSLGRVMWTPIYADFDGVESIDDVESFVEACQVDFDITPDIYYSGNRGYHCFINVEIEHAHPHLVARKFMSTMSQSKYLDLQMYASRHLLRSEGSIHFKTGKYKVRLDTDCLRAYDLNDRASVGGKQVVTEPTKHRSDLIMSFLKGVVHEVDKEVAENEAKYAEAKSECDGEISPCIKAIIAEGPVTGMNNQLLQLIARNMNVAGLSLDDALAEMSSRAVWSLMTKEIQAVFRSIYSQPSRFGCKHNQTLRQYCDPFCPFNDVAI